MLFTNGSYANAPEVRSGSAWLVIDGEDHVAHGKFRAGKVQSFDAEMLALAHGLRKAVHDVPAHITTLIVCSDNQSALDRIFKPEVGPLIGVWKKRRALLPPKEEEAAVHLVQEAEEAACLEAADASQPAEGVEELFEGATTPSKGKKRAREDEGVNAAASKGDRDSSTAPEIDWAQVARRKQQAGEKCDRCRTRSAGVLLRGLLSLGEDEEDVWRRKEASARLFRWTFNGGGQWIKALSGDAAASSHHQGTPGWR
ncbi:hypothetical protein AcV5_005486 [Taiwanofungus camphoratus]|nr:hypothetical protein AcV5_005486 [Antrodia cinnamomea]